MKFGQCDNCRPSWAYYGASIPIILCERHADADVPKIGPKDHPIIETVRKETIKARLAIANLEDRLEATEKWHGSALSELNKAREWIKANGLWDKALADGGVKDHGQAIA